MAECSQQVPQFVVDGGRIGESLENLGSKPIAVLLTEPVNGDAGGAFGHAEIGGGGGVALRGIGEDQGAQGVEDRCFAAARPFIAQFEKDSFEQGEGPAAVEEDLG